MSVPVRYTAAAEFAVVDSGLNNTLQQEEQYHLQQHLLYQQQQLEQEEQQQQQQQQQYYYHQYSSPDYYYQQPGQEQLLFNNINNNNNNYMFDSISGEEFEIQQQQQQQQLQYQQQQQQYHLQAVQEQLFMQQRSSMSSLVSPNPPQQLAANIAQSCIVVQPPANNQTIITTNNHNNILYTNNNNNMMNSSTITPTTTGTIVENSQLEKTAMAAVAAAVAEAEAAAATGATTTASGVAAAAAARAVGSSTGVSTSASTGSSSATAATKASATGNVDGGDGLTSSLSTGSVTASLVNPGANCNDNGGEWMRMSDEGRYGTPGAAGLEYQKYELDQQQQQGNPTPNDQNNKQQQQSNVEPSLLDNENKNEMSSLEAELYAMTSDELYNTLKEYDALQEKYHTVLRLPKESRREVTAGGRDGSAYVLRCLKMWYELPSDVLFAAMSLVDRFLDRMAVKPKHMACMSVASFHLAIKQLNLKPKPAEDLVTISQCGCTAGDLERMAGVIANKLGVQMGHAPITSVSYLRIYFALFRILAKEIGGQFFEFYKQMIKLEELENRLEILLCDVKTTVITPSTLALVLICLHLDFHIKESYTRGSPELKHVFEYILFLQQFMNIPDRVFTCGFSIVSGILSHYNGQNKQPYKQRLVWKLSSRTLRVLRPMNRFSSDLPTIQEGISNPMDESLRARTESISSEEEEDWPTSPIIPIFEQC